MSELYRNALRNLLIPAALGLALLAGGCSQGQQQDDASQQNGKAPLAGASIGGDFTLTSQDGQPVSWKDFAGQYRIVYFGFTFCPDICPTDLQLIAQGLNAYAKDKPDLAKKIQPIFISVDPDRDTPEVLKQYVAAFHPRLIGLTGSEEDIAATAKKFAVYYQKEDSEGASNYNVNHSTQIYLFDPDGKPIALLPDDGSPEAFAKELGKWVH